MSSALSLPSHMAGFLHELGSNSSGVYSYVSYPSVMRMGGGGQRPTFRSEAAVNIMHDRRVVRGNTYAQKLPFRSLVWSTDLTRPDNHTIMVKKRPVSQKSGVRPCHDLLHNRSWLNSKETNVADARHTAARARARKKISGVYHHQLEQSDPRLWAPPGRTHITIQTDQWLEEILDRAPEIEAAVQTDQTVFVPWHLPKSVDQDTGVDKSTQILPDDPDLFEFDKEVVGILESLVGNALEQGILEVMDEEEVASIAGTNHHDFYVDPIVTL